MTSIRRLNRSGIKAQFMSHDKSLRDHTVRSGILLTIWFLLMAGINIWNLNQLVEPIHELRDEVLAFNRLLMKLSESTSKSYRHFNHLFLRLSRQEHEWLTRLKNELQQEQQEAQGLVTELDRLPWEKFDWATTIKEDWREYRALYGQYLEATTNMLRAIPAEPLSEPRLKELYGHSYSDESRVLRAKILELENRLLERIRELSRQSQTLSRNASNKAELLLALLWLLGLLISTILLWFMRKDLQHTVSSVFQGLMDAKEQFQAIFAQVDVAGAQVYSQAKESAERLVQITQGAKSLKEQVSQSATLAQAMHQMAHMNREDVERGAQDLQNWQQQMREIRDESFKVQNVVAVIDDIAFQINLLALNAAVEAARAGEEGRGFAVVAQAIRGLAQKSAEAVQEIHTLSSQTVQLVEQSDQAGTEVLQAFEQLRQEVVRLNDLNQEIATGAEEQNSGLAQMTQALEQISEALRRNSEHSQSLSDMSKALAHDVDTLEFALGQYSFMFNLAATSSKTGLKESPLLKSSVHGSAKDQPMVTESSVSQLPEERLNTRGVIQLKQEQSPKAPIKEEAAVPSVIPSSSKSGTSGEAMKQGSVSGKIPNTDLLASDSSKQQNQLPEMTRQASAWNSSASEDEFWAEAIEKIEKRKKAS